MGKRILTEDGGNIAIIHSDEVLITDAQSALDLIASLSWNDDCDCMILNKEAISEAFFTLSNGIAGDVLQKFSNYRKKLAIIGDFSHYQSKPLKDYIYESNNGNCVFFVSTEREAVEKLKLCQA